MNRLNHNCSGFSIPSQTRLRALASLLLLSGTLILGSGHALAQTNTNLLTKFVPDAVLTSTQVQDVLELARQCGVTNAQELKTFYFYHVGRLCLEVKDKEDVSKLTVDYCTVDVHWTAWGQQTTNVDAKRVGEFWVDPPYLETNHFALFMHDNKSLRIRLDPEIALSVATTIFKGIENGDVAYPSGTFSKSLYDIGKLDRLNFGPNLAYQLVFSNHMFLYVRLINGKVEVTGEGTWHI
jgi:hypothetical protein